mgnify:CR=1 FL=1
MPNITVARRQNALALFQDYAEKALAQGTPPKGLEQAFAATLQISPSMWSQVKSSRPIGDKLARQIEAMTGRTVGWLDAQRKDASPTPAQTAFLEIALCAYRATNVQGRKALKAHMDALMREAEQRYGPTGTDKLGCWRVAGSRNDWDTDVDLSFRRAAAGRVQAANVGGRRYLTLAGHAAERPLYLQSCRTTKRGRQTHGSTSGRAGQRQLPSGLTGHSRPIAVFGAQKLDTPKRSFISRAESHSEVGSGSPTGGDLSIVSGGASAACPSGRPQQAVCLGSFLGAQRDPGQRFALLPRQSPPQDEEAAKQH